IDAVIPEPSGGAHRDWQLAAKFIEEQISQALAELEPLSTQELIAKRIEKFRRIGKFKTVG
ncbi:acetyl-CoA carboxylase carboxyl transferase subunit alpha, partial [candidate division WOR-3 bacterium]|nr:acetyl-CoA carboxylase carboxyl transferase subunit alpha [candidate division WOR-3 bacterium]